MFFGVGRGGSPERRRLQKHWRRTFLAANILNILSAPKMSTFTQVFNTFEKSADLLVFCYLCETRFFDECSTFLACFQLALVQQIEPPDLLEPFFCECFTCFACFRFLLFFS